jgi:hypothetical protein
LSSLGFLRLHAGDDSARTAFAAADALNPGAARSVLGLHLSGSVDPRPLQAAVDELHQGPKAIDAILIEAARLAWTGHAAEAAEAIRSSLTEAPPGPMAWNVAADPMFLPLHGHAQARDLAAAIASRAA